jgi:diguanylate cyclase (GGDEF)-like protein
MIAAICITLYHYQQNPESATDAITRLFNRRFLGEYLQTKFMEHKEFGAIMIAMDDFKFINKTYGVDCGDSLLRQVGGYLEEIEKSAQVFRFGSDEFCVILNKNVSDMKKTAEEIQARFHHPWYTDSQAAIMMSASICCIRCPQEADSYNMLVDVADYTMGIAKKTKKGKITMAADVELTKVYNDKAIERAVKLALAKDELMVHYQPIYSVEKKKYCSAEALVRLYNKKLGWISPEDFIPIAEKNGMIIEMGEVILKKVCQFIKNYNLADTSIEYIEVNISPAQLVQMDFADRAIAIMKEYGVKANQMNFEITETSMISSLATVKDNINKLINYGITFALDDYGSGYANIDYINHMPFTLIKLDKYIIWDSFKNPKAGVTLEYTIGMMNALNLYIVAEGVETEEMYQTLADFGCHYMQGWYYSKAVCEEDFMELIGERVS